MENVNNIVGGDHDNSSSSSDPRAVLVPIKSFRSELVDVSVTENEYETYLLCFLLSVIH